MGAMEDLASMSANGSLPQRAFGVDPKRAQRYNLRQARYDALASDIDALAGNASQAGRRLAVLDIGCGRGTAATHLSAKPNFHFIDIDATEVRPGAYRKLDTSLYRSIFYGDLTKGYPELPSSSYDVVICEQVLEHLIDLDIAIETIGRLIKPGGRAFVGVPIFLPPLHLVRRHVVPAIDRLMGRKERGHVQAFTLTSFKKSLLAHSKLGFVEARGFRIISGGPLRPLEEFRGWWAFNRWLGTKMPAACTEVQVILERPF